MHLLCSLCGVVRRVRDVSGTLPTSEYSFLLCDGMTVFSLGENVYIGGNSPLNDAYVLMRGDAKICFTRKYSDISERFTHISIAWKCVSLIFAFFSHA